MNIIELNQSEITGIAGGFGVIDVFNTVGGVVGSYAAAVLLLGLPRDFAGFKLNAGWRGNLLVAKGLLATPYLIKTGIIAGCVVAGNAVGGIVGAGLGKLF